MARGLKYRIKKVEGCTISIEKAKALISCAVTEQLICAFVFAFAKGRFSHYAAQIESCMHAYVLIVEFNKLVAEKL